MELTYSDLQQIYNQHFSLGFLGNDINNKFALISLVCYLTSKIQTKIPDYTNYKTLVKLNCPKNLLNRLSIICDDLSYCCTSFPIFGLTDKEIPDKIKELLNNSVPF